MKCAKYDAFSVAARIVNEQISKGKPISNLVLQKVLYYAEAAFLVDDQELFYDDISAWRYGPVVENVYHYFKIYLDRKITEEVPEEIIGSTISCDDWEKIREVVEAQIKFEAFDLVRRTHEERPWLESVNNNKEYISKKTMQEYFLQNRGRIYGGNSD